MVYMCNTQFISKAMKLESALLGRIILLVTILLSLFAVDECKLFVSSGGPPKGSASLTSILAKSSKSGSIDEDNNVRGNERNEGSKKPRTARMQWMITQSMRATLVRDLGYEDAEVDAMEPQIAAVLIERRLRRPPQGMPASWRRRTKNKRSVVSKFQSFSDKYLGPSSPTVVFFKKHMRTILSVTAIACGAILARERFLQLTQSTWQWVLSNQRKPDLKKDSVNKGTWSFSLPHYFRKTGAPNVQKTILIKPKIDLLEFDKIQSASLWDKLMVKINLWKYQ